MMPGSDMTRVDRLTARAYEVPTDKPESDGTMVWDSTTIVIVEAVGADGMTGTGWTYTHQAATSIVETKLAEVVTSTAEPDPRSVWPAMVASVRNLGRQGVVACAISAVDVALWDLFAKRLGVPVVDALGRHRDEAAAYGSGGFCTYSPAEVADQLGGWTATGFDSVKMKVGRTPTEDRARLAAARDAIGDDATLMVDANGAFTFQQARRWAQIYAGDFGVRWYEEPVTSDDTASLRRLRHSVPGGLEIAAGEYGWDPWYYETLLEAEAVDCPQADVTRCGGFIGFLRSAETAESHHLDISAHCAPTLSAHVGCAARRFRHLEYFHDHVRIERMFFDGFIDPVESRLRPDPTRPGLGIELKTGDADRYRLPT